MKKSIGLQSYIRAAAIATVPDTTVFAAKAAFIPLKAYPLLGKECARRVPDASFAATASRTAATARAVFAPTYAIIRYATAVAGDLLAVTATVDTDAAKASAFAHMQVA